MSCIKSSHINYNQPLLQKRDGTVGTGGLAQLLAKTKTCRFLLFLFHRQIPFFFPRVSLLISIFLYQKHLFPLIKRTKIKRSSFLESKIKKKRKVSETKARVSLITSLHAGGQELNESLKRICKRTCVVNKPARRLHAASDFSKNTHLNAPPLLTN